MARLDAPFAELRQSVQAHFLHGRHRQCISLCRSALDAERVEDSPLRTTFLYYYAALSYEALARNMHSRSPAFETTLDEAHYCFNAARHALPVPQPPSQVLGVELGDVNDPRRGSSYIEAPATPPNRRSDSSCGSTLSQATELSCATAATSVGGYDSAPEIGYCFCIAFHGSPHHYQDHRRAALFDDNVLGFHGMLEHHISLLHELRAAKSSARNVEAGTAFGFAPYMHPGFRMNMESGGWQKPGMSTDEKMDRIKRGRAREWKRERFDPERYERLCDAALSELSFH